MQSLVNVLPSQPQTGANSWVQKSCCCEIKAYQRAVGANPNDTHAWICLDAGLVQKAAQEEEPNRRAELLGQALEAGTKIAELGAGHYALACALALLGGSEEALQELGGCLARGEVSAESCVAQNSRS
jgi:hypothetical protein